MKTDFAAENLVALYDKGVLVPFIGSGMSRDACASWEEMVTSLENQANLNPSTGQDLMRRGQIALEQLRFLRKNLADAVYNALASDPEASIPEQSKALASLYWPLVCTTNYDDIYLRAVVANGRQLPQILGRSEIDCRRVLQHISLPATEAVWTLQGFLGWRHDEIKKRLPEHFNTSQCAAELVVGHSEYRRAANRAPHFRRCFAEIFRSRSFLFLGAGLTEPYFLTLFDEIIELVGPPVRPHFAIIEEGRVDVEFMLRQYHILCRTYPKKKHEQVGTILRDFTEFTTSQRNRAFIWGFQPFAPFVAEKSGGLSSFSIVRGPLPTAKEIKENEALGISCGRDLDAADPKSIVGIPLVSRHGAKSAGFDGPKNYEWPNQSQWIVRFGTSENVFGIVAREVIDPNELRESNDRRSPDAIRIAFLAFLDEMTRNKITTAHVQLLAAGSKKIFHPWVSLVQMARAYGEWHRKHIRINQATMSLLDVRVYVVDPSAIAILQGGYINLSDQLQDAPMRIGVDIIHADGEVERYHQIVEGHTMLAELIPHAAGLKLDPPALYVLPASRIVRDDSDFYKSIVSTVREFGLVSGSTLVVDYRPGMAVAPKVEREDPEMSSAIMATPTSLDVPQNSSANSIADNEVTVLKSLIESSFSLRSITGISKETGLTKPLVNTTLSSLIAKGFVAQTLNSNDQLRWYATPKGRSRMSKSS